MKRLVNAPIQQRMDVYTQRTASCWNWTGTTNQYGHGQIYWQGKLHPVHRIAWSLENGPIPEGLVIDHICRNPSCVRPAHLQAVTQKQNSENLGLSVANTSGVRGVTWNKRARKWHAQVGHNRRNYNAGDFSTIEEAERAVIELRNRLHTNNLSDRG